MKAALALAAVALAGPALAQMPGERAEPITIVMTDQGFAPANIVLHRGAPYVLRVINRSGKGHNLTQEVFWRVARVAPADRGWTRDGKIVVPSGGRAIVHFIAPMSRPGGEFQFSSTTIADAPLDYKGRFLIR